MGTTVNPNHLRGNGETAAARDSAILSNTELGIWPQNKMVRKQLRKKIEEVLNIEIKIGEKVCEECGQLYVIRSLVLNYRRPPPIRGRRERKGDVYESFQRNENGAWALIGTVKWRGNKELLAWPPPISPLPPYWAIDEESPGGAKPEI